MAITVETPAESTMLTTVEMLRADLGAQASGEANALFERHIKAASTAIVRYCGRDFAQQEIIETMPLNGGRIMKLSRIPIVEIEEILFEGDLVDDALYSLVEPEAGMVQAEDGWNYTAGLYTYSVQYTYGFVLPSFSSGTRNLPDDIESACLALARNSYFGRARDSGISSEEVADVYSVKYNNATPGGSRNTMFTSEIRDLLQPYRLFKL